MDLTDGIILVSMACGSWAGEEPDSTYARKGSDDLRVRTTLKSKIVIAISIASIFSTIFSGVASAATYKIRRGDSLWKIARKNRTTVSRLCKANGLREKSTLKPGKTITIPEPNRSGRPWKSTSASVAGKISGQQVAGSHSQNSSLVSTALACRGTRYRRGGTSRGGFDCSGFTCYVFSKYGIRLPHSSAAQARVGTPVPRNQLKEGDLLFFHTYRSGISHVGIYIGGNKFVHAARHGRGVTVDSLGSSYYAPRYRGARRVR